MTLAPRVSLEQAVEAVRKNKAALDDAETTMNFHTKMAASAHDEVKKHKRNLEVAERSLANAAASPKTGAGSSVIAPKPQPTLIQGR